MCVGFLTKVHQQGNLNGSEFQHHWQRNILLVVKGGLILILWGCQKIGKEIPMGNYLRKAFIKEKKLCQYLKVKRERWQDLKDT